MITYFVTYVSGESRELEADFFQREGEDWVFVRGGEEVLRVEVEEVAGITKSRSFGEGAGMYEQLPVRELAIGEEVFGRYRGSTPETDTESARLFLEAEEGPLAIACDGRVLIKLNRLNVSDGYHVSIVRLSDSVHHVALAD